MVTFCGGDIISESVKAIIGQVNHLLIVDNHSDAATLKYLDDVRQRYSDKVTVVLNEENRGVAAALNQGLRFAVQNGYEWALTLDQDSEAETSMVRRMLEACDRYADRDRVGIIAPQSLFVSDGKCTDFPDDGTLTQRAVEVDLTHTSGNLVRLAVLGKVGLFREDLFVDQVDYEFCFRLRRAGLKIVVVTSALMRHRPGDLRSVRFLHKRVFCSNYSAVRRYYIARNGILISKQNRNWSFLRRHSLLVVKEVAKVLLYEDHKWAKLRLTLLGVKDGVVGKVGKLASAGGVPNECVN
jgi:rhamnosyltransferase